MSDILVEIREYISEFNSDNNIDFEIDTIRVKFSKQHKLETLNSLGKWHKLTKSSNILYKLKQRLNDDEVTSVYRLENLNIYYYNERTPPKYRNAMLVIFGMEQYHKASPPKELISKILSVLKNVTNLDVCFDTSIKPDLNKLKEYFYITQYINKDGVFTNTHYINDTGVLMLEKITIYDKAFKNNLSFKLWRYEAKISIPDFRYLALPLHEFKDIINIGRDI